MPTLPSFLLWFIVWHACQRHQSAVAFVPTSRIKPFQQTPHNRHSKSSKHILDPINLQVSTRRRLPRLRITLSPTTQRSSTENSEKIPFVIEELKHPSDKVYKEISKMCISAFFNDGDQGRQIPFWKELQLSYLRSLQQNDLRRRRSYYPKTNFMLVARRVVPAEEGAALHTPLLLDLSQVYNLDKQQLQKQQEVDFCRGEVLGFVEVTQRPFGLGGESAISSFEQVNNGATRNGSRFYTDRPVLTNLSVKYEARQSGVGSRMLELCEQIVQSRWNLNEIILEVEEDNINAMSFYERRGYKVVYEDPTSRRYDTNGIVLRQLRCRRKIMRKQLSTTMSVLAPDLSDVSSSFVNKAWQRIKDTVKL